MSIRLIIYNYILPVNLKIPLAKIKQSMKRQIFSQAQSDRLMQRSLPLSAELPLDVAVKETQKAQSCGRLHLPVELFHDDLLHPHHVRHCKSILTDAYEIIGQRHVLLVLSWLHSNVEAAQAHAGQVLWLNLGRDRKYDEILRKVKCHDPNRSFSSPMHLLTFITERNLSRRLMANEKVSVLNPKNLVRESRSLTSSSLSLVVILRPLSWDVSMSLKPLSFGWYRLSQSVRAFSWTAKGNAPGPVTVSIICVAGETGKSDLLHSAHYQQCDSVAQKRHLLMIR